MRAIPILLAALLLAPALLGAGLASSPTALVEAGPGQRVGVDQAFLLQGHVEDFGGPLAVLWSGPADCALDTPTELLVGVVCSLAGVHAFTLSASDGVETASDTVLVVVVEEETFSLAAAQGVIALGLPDEAGDTTSGSVDRSTARVSFTTPVGTTRLTARLSWTGNNAATADLNSFSLALVKGATQHLTPAGTTPRALTVNAPASGPWRAEVRPETVVDATWDLQVDGLRLVGDAPMPTIEVPRTTAAPGETVTLSANVQGGTPPYAIAWESDATSRRFDDGAGANHSFLFTAATALRVKVTDDAGFEAMALVPVGVSGAQARPMTIVAVVDSSFSPYHFDFLGREHPWNTDADDSNDHDFSADPASYIAGHPGATALPITLPASASTDVDALRAADAPLWAQMPSSSFVNGVNLVWFPGTKVVAAARFGGTFQAGNGAHGSASASVAAGNHHGSCPECLFVLLQGGSTSALKWAAAQPWIDIVTNSYGSSTTLVLRDNIYLAGPVAETKAASESGQVVVFSAGNGLLNAFDVPAFTYWSSEKGPDWIVTVGAVTPNTEQTYTGAGKPVDISSIGNSYPSSGGSTANGTGSHSGTSNAAPVTAGYFAKTLQKAREALHDDTPGHAAGIVASGDPVACGAAWSACPLADGILTRRELTDLVFLNVLPSPARVVTTTAIPTTQFAYHYQGHGVLSGRSQGAAEYEAEWTRMTEAALGNVAPYDRPEGERAWFLADSACRQKVWGAWTGGDYVGGEPEFVLPEDAPGAALFAACANLPPSAFT